MKITNKQLMQIIKEELENVLSEGALENDLELKKSLPLGAFIVMKIINGERNINALLSRYRRFIPNKHITDGKMLRDEMENLYYKLGEQAVQVAEGKLSIFEVYQSAPDQTRNRGAREDILKYTDLIDNFNREGIFNKDFTKEDY